MAEPLVIRCRENGPLVIQGLVRVVDHQGKEFAIPPGKEVVALCRCGASKHKPYCDGSHHAIGFSATGEPPSGTTDMLPVRDGALRIDPQANGPLRVRGNLEIVSGTGRVVARTSSANLCRCGGSATKPFCDGTHARIGFVS